MVTPVELGISITPTWQNREEILRLARVADEGGLDLIGIQDHPYQWRFFDTWTLIAYLAATTSRIRFFPDVTTLPLRPPAVLAKAAASLDVLTGGRVELGLGAGAFWDAIEAMGGPRRTPGEAVDALEEAMAILRAFWSGDRSVTVEGEHYRVKGAKPGPQPAHRIGIWVGAYGPRMLRLTGRLADGWLPSLGRMEPGEIAEKQRTIDESAERAGRSPADIRRVLNASVESAPGGWADQLVGAGELGFQTLIVSVHEDDPVAFVRRLGEDVAPRVREALS
jgi:alkanesulfonate monooxygenase SsuD/methylene tetrahydromethanopterin reductase-like flavin-dependent oxidoreductase (luciferase family)